MRQSRVSLIGLFAFVTCGVLATSHVITSLRLRRANEVLAQLRSRVDLMAVPDTDRIAARRLPTTEDHVHRWAIRLPADVAYKLYVSISSLPASGFPASDAKSTRAIELTTDPDTQETTVSVEFARNPNDPRWGSITVDVGDSVQKIAVAPELTEVLMGDVPRSIEAIGEKAVTRDGTRPVQLLSVRPSGATSGSAKGLIVWLSVAEK